MKKFKISVALLAIIFAVASAFTSKTEDVTVDGFYANKDRNPTTEQTDPVGNESEANIDMEVGAGTLTAWANLHCVDPFTRICSVQIIDDEIADQKDGSYLP